ncbi:acyl-CoA dehydrogenase C-terminal domain-containing protein [Colwelliaceae bacterium 6471]
MSDYKAPLKDMQFLLHDVFNVAKLWAEIPQLADVIDRETADAILEEGAKLTSQVIAPLNRNSDEQGAIFADGNVVTPDGFANAYQLYCQGGWGALSGDPHYGGMGMPKMLQSAVEEMTQSASISFALYPMLTAGACLALSAHGCETLKSIYLEKMYSGQWAGTMCLTEPHAGSDLGIMTSKAEAAENNSFKISGTKIFITGGEQDLTENIIHLVLAKIPGAPAGPRGISMFVVPKFLLNDDGSLDARNSVSCGSIEHKMGIKGSATAVMNFDGATGYLVGEPNKGLNYMFTMMNYERLGMGIQGVGAAETSYQIASQYALERQQGRAATGAQSPAQKADSILVHPDVRKMLLTMRSLTEAGRCFSLYVAKQLDIVKFTNDVEQKHAAESMVALLTPVAKAFLTDMAFESCVHGQMVLGGHGYVREWEQEQLVRDVRIAQIYEGTNGIQSLDLLGRKIAADNGKMLELYLQEIQTFIDNNAEQEPMSFYIQSLENAVSKLKKVTQLLLDAKQSDKNAIGASATDYQAIFGYVSYAYMWNMMVEKSLNKLHAGDDFYQGKLYLAQFYMSRILPRIDAHIKAIEAGSDSIMSMPESFFA